MYTHRRCNVAVSSKARTGRTFSLSCRGPLQLQRFVAPAVLVCALREIGKHSYSRIYLIKSLFARAGKTLYGYVGISDALTTGRSASEHLE